MSLRFLPIFYRFRILGHEVLYECMFVADTCHENEMNLLRIENVSRRSVRDYQRQQLTSSPRIMAFFTCSLVKPQDALGSFLR